MPVSHDWVGAPIRLDDRPCRVRAVERDAAGVITRLEVEEWKHHPGEWWYQGTYTGEAATRVLAEGVLAEQDFQAAYERIARQGGPTILDLLDTFRREGAAARRDAPCRSSGPSR